MLKKDKNINTFAMRSEKFKGLKKEGFNTDEIIMLKEELGKIAEAVIKDIRK